MDAQGMDQTVPDMNGELSNSVAGVKTDVDLVETRSCSMQNTTGDLEKPCTIPNGLMKFGADDNGIVKHTKNDHLQGPTGDARSIVTTTSKEDSASGESVEYQKCDRTSDCDLEEKKHVSSDEKHVCGDSVDTDICENLEKTTLKDPCNSESQSLDNSESAKSVQKGIDYVVYESELQMPDIMRLITKDLSEPYSIYTYRYFIHNWPKLCFLAMCDKECVGAIVCKLDLHKKMVRRGYIAMLAIDQHFRRRGIGSHLVLKAIRAMVEDDCDEVVLETEITNKAALRLYENLGFVRDKRLFRYYLNGVDALRLKLWLR